MESFISGLIDEIKKGLPGTEVQWELASSDRRIREFPRTPGSDASEAAVLIMLYSANGHVHTVFIQRPEYNGVHSGQIGFPGGKKEKEDRDLVETAIREAQEEAGISRHNLKVVGLLTPLFIPVSNIVVTPVVAWMNTTPSFTPDNEEVMFIIEADLSEFISYSIIREKPFEIRGEKINIKYFDYRNNVIWGASAMILHELLTLIRRAGLSHQV